MSSIYPNVSSHISLGPGFSESITFPSVNTIPLRANAMYDASSSEHPTDGLRPVHFPQLILRNTSAYPYVLNDPCLKYDSQWTHKSLSNARIQGQLQAQYYNQHYPHSIPHTLLQKWVEQDHAEQDQALKDTQMRQGNVLCAIEHGVNSHLLCYPTGKILQQVRVMSFRYHHHHRASGHEDENQINGMTSQSSDAIETGSIVRQIESMHPTSTSAPYRILVRGAATGMMLNIQVEEDEASILDSNSNHSPEEEEKKESSSQGERLSVTASMKHVVKCPSLLCHLATSPHTSSEAAFLTTDGEVHFWSGVHGLVQYNGKASFGKLVACEYSAHPRVLWTINRRYFGILDQRQSQQNSPQEWLDASCQSPGQLFGLKRHPVYVHLS